MGSVTDGFPAVMPWGTQLVQGGTGQVSGSATDGMRIMGAPYYAPPAAALPEHGWWDTPVVAAPPPAPAPAPTPDPTPTPTPDPTPTPAPITPLDPGRPVLEQPTTAGNSLGNAIADSILNPPAHYWVGGVDQYNKAKKAGSLTTTQT